MVMGFNEIIDCEIVFPIVKPCATTDDLLELDYGVDRAHEDDVSDVAGVYAGGEFL